MCDQFLSAGQKRIVLLYCGAHSGEAPLSISSIAARIGKPIDQTQQSLQAALRMLPLRRLLNLKEHLDNPHHKYHQGLSEAQRQALRRLIDGAVQLQNRRQAQTSTEAAARPEPTPRPLGSAAPDPMVRERPPQSQGFFSSSHALATALDAFGRPTHAERIYAQVDWSRGRVSMTVALSLLRSNREFLALDGDVFALARWQNRRPEQPDQLLYCPRLPIHDQAEPTRYLEYILMLLDQLHQKLMTAGEVWQWASRRVVGNVHVQDVFDLHYALGLHDEVRYAQDKARLLRPLIQVGSDLSVFRLACLRTLLSRAPFMAQTLAAVAHGRRMTTEQVAALAYEDARDAGDLRARLRLLEALGAMRQERAAWLLSSLGERLLAELPTAPALRGTESVASAQVDDEDVGMLEL
ncbi:MAG: hypothetical protein NZ750_12485 [Anaerolineae bacterium]|nr:hypothetical protein [Anaerolineae bacterium]